jgi:putative methylase
MKTFEPDKAKVWLEQYATDAIAAVEMIFVAGFVHGDLDGRIVVDLGIGTGRLAIPALFFGAERAVGIEVDEDALVLARENAELFGVRPRLDLVQADATQAPALLAPIQQTHRAGGITVVMNPPFGVQDKGADTRFLDAALAIPGVRVIYSCHLSGEKNRAFLKRYIERAGWILSELRQVNMMLPKLYEFHEKVRKQIQVDIYRITCGMDQTRNIEKKE